MQRQANGPTCPDACHQLSGSIMRTAMKPTLWIFSAILLTPHVLRADEYTLGPDSQRHDGVPKGTVTKHTWTSKIFPGTVRDYWIYVPTQYRPGRPAPFMVFQDGGGFVTDSGSWRAPIVFTTVAGNNGQTGYHGYTGD